MDRITLFFTASVLAAALHGLTASGQTSTNRVGVNIHARDGHTAITIPSYKGASTRRQARAVVSTPYAPTTAVPRGLSLSTNIVGCQLWLGNTNSMWMFAPTFKPVGTDGSRLSIDDIGVSRNYNADALFIRHDQVLNNVRTTTNYTYYPVGDPYNYGLQGGWYNYQEYMEEDYPDIVHAVVGYGVPDSFMYGSYEAGTGTGWWMQGLFVMSYGELPVGDTTVDIPDDNDLIMGTGFPAKLHLTDIEFTDIPDPDGFGWGGEIVSRMDRQGNVIDEVFFTRKYDDDGNEDGFWWSRDLATEVDAEKDFVIGPGEVIQIMSDSSNKVILHNRH